jgi:hypothetical protein
MQELKIKELPDCLQEDTCLTLLVKIQDVATTTRSSIKTIASLAFLIGVFIAYRTIYLFLIPQITDTLELDLQESEKGCLEPTHISDLTHLLISQITDMCVTSAHQAQIAFLVSVCSFIYETIFKTLYQ